MKRPFLPFAASGFVVLIACLVLIGWKYDIAILRSILPSWVAMNPTTAVLFILSGVALSAVQMEEKKWSGHVVRILALVVALLGFVQFSSYVFSLNLGIDQVLFSGKLRDAPVRLAPNTALNFVFVGVALVLLSKRSARLFSDILMLLTFMIGLIAALGYLYSEKLFYEVAYYVPIALTSAASFMVLSVGMLATHPDRGFMEVITSDSPGGMMARRLLPAAIGVPVLLGWLRLKGQEAGLYTGEFGTALVVVASIVLFAMLISWNARSLRQLETERKMAEEDRNRIFMVSLDLLCVAGFDGYFKHVNPAWEKTLGHTSEELLGRPYIEFVHPDDRAVTVAKAENIHAGSSTILFENRYRCKDGSYRWLMWSATPDMEHRFIYAGARDVTERKRAEEEREAALAKVKVLGGLLPICAYCKQIRDDKGYWHAVEVYIANHSQAEFTHGMCSNCLKKHFDKYAQG